MIGQLVVGKTRMPSAAPPAGQAGDFYRADGFVLRLEGPAAFC